MWSGWTWVTSTCIIAGFTAAAYSGGEFYRSNDPQVRAVSVIDSVNGQGTWATVYAGIFAPDSDDYRLDGLAAGEWWAAISPMRDEYAYMPPSHLGGRSLYCRQGDGANLPVSLPISIYSMQCLLGESKQAQAPLSVKADAGGGSVTIEVTNRLAHPAKRILVWHDKKSWEFPALAGEATTRLVLDRPEAQGGRIHATVRPLEGAVLSAQGVSRRTQAIGRYREKGAMVVLAEYDQPPLSHTVQSGRCGRDHVLFARVVVPMTGSVRQE